MTFAGAAFGSMVPSVAFHRADHHPRGACVSDTGSQPRFDSARSRGDAGQAHVERASLAGLTARRDRNRSAVLLHDSLGNGEPEAEATVLRTVGAAETFEDDLLLLL